MYINTYIYRTGAMIGVLMEVSYFIQGRTPPGIFESIKTKTAAKEPLETNLSEF
jgi:hypothetical protein